LLLLLVQSEDSAHHSADGQAIGQVSTLFIDSASWHVESLQVKLRDEVADQLGAPRSIIQAATLELPIRMVQSVGDAVVLLSRHKRSPADSI
jgi:sporulation protein YlmC with PRC-barrel domain